MAGNDSSQASQASEKPIISFTEEQLAFCTQIPKIELHAHLNGSIRLETIRELAQKQSIDPELLQLTNKGRHTQLFGFECHPKVSFEHLVSGSPAENP